MPRPAAAVVVGLLARLLDDLLAHVLGLPGASCTLSLTSFRSGAFVLLLLFGMILFLTDWGYGKRAWFKRGYQPR
jgi:hypothetical protein